MYILLISAIIIQLVTLFRTPFYNYFNKLDGSIYIYSTMDMLITCLVLYSIWNVSNRRVKEQINAWCRVEKVSHTILCITIVLFIYALSLAFSSISFILSGATRQALITEHNMFGFGYLLVSSYFKIMFPMYLITNVRKLFKFLLGIGFLLSMIITASRNELIYAGYLIATIYMIRDFRHGFKTVTIVIVAFMLLAFFITIMQGRPVGDGFISVISVFDKHLLYRSYSLYLSDRVTSMPLDVDKYLYPFFGYISDKFLSILSLVNNSIDNSFVSHYEFLGYDKGTGNYYYANVLYPWWSWFILAFGPIGILIKSIYIFFVFYVLLRVGFIFTYLYLMSIVLYSSPFYTPLITIGGVISIFITVFIDIKLRRENDV